MSSRLEAAATALKGAIAEKEQKQRAVTALIKQLKDAEDAVTAAQAKVRLGRQAVLNAAGDVVELPG